MKLFAVATLLVITAAVVNVYTPVGGASAGPGPGPGALPDIGGNSSAHIKKVYIVFSNHFDCGYTLNVNGSTSGAVINQYFHHHFPAAIVTANEARAKGGKPYKWMTQSWLVAAYRNCPATKVNRRGPSFPSDVVCPSPAAVQAFEAAVRRGDIVWHAFPFNGEPELFTPELFDAALNLTFEQDAYFGHAKRRTLSQRDVPGLTRAAIPLLVARGVEGVSVGENSQVAPSAVPPVFLWRDNATGTEVVALFHALGYGGAFPAVASDDEPRPPLSTPRAAAKSSRFPKSGTVADGSGGHIRVHKPDFYLDRNGDAVVMDTAVPYDDGPSIHVLHPHTDGALAVGPGTVEGNQTRNEACVTVDAAGVAVCYAWKIDNSGPHNYTDSQLIFDAIGVFFTLALVCYVATRRVFYVATSLVCYVATRRARARVWLSSLHAAHRFPVGGMVLREGENGALKPWRGARFSRRTVPVCRHGCQ